MADQLAELRTAEGGIAITRVFDAPRELVWKEWTEPERFADWFGGSEVEVPLASVLTGTYGHGLQVGSGR